MNVSPSLASNQSQNFPSLYPHCLVTGTPAPGAFNVTWPGTACGTCCNQGTDWLKLKVQVDAPTFYGYSTVAGGSTVIGATGDLPGERVQQADDRRPSQQQAELAVERRLVPVVRRDRRWGRRRQRHLHDVLISSFDNEVYIDMDGE